MPISISGSGTITGISAGGLPDGCVTTDDLADASVTTSKLSTAPYQATRTVAVASTSGTSIDFTGLPSWVKRITVMFQGVSGSGTSPFQIQLGTSSGIDTASSYLGCVSNSASFTNFSTGFLVRSSTGAATETWHGQMVISSLGSNVWAESGLFALSSAANIWFTAGTKSLSGVLDRIRITTVNGTDTFDAGTINILYEG